MGKPRRGVNECFEALGWRHFGKDEGVIKRPKFNFKPLNDLYKTEIGNLFTKLSASAVDRNDPKLFDKELDKILEKLGPPIWPNKPANVQRTHLRDPDPETLYRKHLIYPRDKQTIKEHLRQLVLAKKSRGTAAATANIDRSALRNGASDEPARGRARPKAATKGPLAPQPDSQSEEDDSDDEPEPTPNINKSVLRSGTSAEKTKEAAQKKRQRQEEPDVPRKRQRAEQKGQASQAKGKQTQVYPTGGTDAFEQTRINFFNNHTPLGSVALRGCDSAAQLLERVEDATNGSAQREAGAEVAYLKIYLSEDMSTEPWVRIDNNRHREGKFQHLRSIIRDAPLFPGAHEALLEAEVGF
ncbi:hypothetical protein BU16DRAFT_613943 [Lophium mytilinum]|uniref:Uncharacterized protein n=1 Tax=Lophium mytilinum TaxID=390894 RepID=A0A6A6R6Q4_9PEZI|nr:hypothetical protein BU16DRAFT_613943 [Lophium mytilinum]